MLCGNGGTSGTTTNAPVIDCQTALQNYRHRNECRVDNIEEVTPDSMACSSECRALAYDLADGCQGVRSMHVPCIVTHCTYTVAMSVHIFITIRPTNMHTCTCTVSHVNNR